MNPSQVRPENFKIQIRTLGTLEVTREGHVVAESDWHTRQARQLLKILITERPRPVANDRLIEILWPQSPLKAAATTLRSAINALRNVLEPTRPSRAPSRYIHTQAPGYAFGEHPDIWLDVTLFEQALDHAQQIVDPQIQAQYLLQAIDLYKDDYLVSDPYADWAHAERERLRERYFDALLELATLQSAVGNYQAAMSACRRVLARDEVRENAYQALMRYQAESGDSAGALVTYERCRTILAEELGADPSPLTQMWHQRILNGEIAPQSAIQPVVSQHASSKRKEMEQQSTPDPESTATAFPQNSIMPILDENLIEIFVGRDKEHSLLLQKLEQTVSDQGKVVILEGEAGIGKTRMAYHLLQAAVAKEMTVISVTCQALEQHLPFASLADSIGRYLYSLPDSALERLPMTSLGQLAQIIPSLCDRLRDLPTPPADAALGADENRQRLIDGIVSFLSTLSKLRPLVLFIDDIHWADADTITVLSRLSQRIDKLPLLALLTYRTEDLSENKALITLLHSFNRVYQDHVVHLQRFSLPDIQTFIHRFANGTDEYSPEIADLLYETTQGNALFLTEALHILDEHWTDICSEDQESSAGWIANSHSDEFRQILSLRRNQRVQEIILERIERLPDSARDVLLLGAVIGRDFSLELLESAAQSDPISGLELLLQRKFLLERPDEHLDFCHEVVRSVAYDSMSVLQRRRLHYRIGSALVHLEQDVENPSEVAFHYSQSGRNAQEPFACYSVLAGEKLLHTFGFRQAIEHFDDALFVLQALPRGDREMIQRALLGRGLAYESLLDVDGIIDTYRRIQQWSQQWDERAFLINAQNRLIYMLDLVGQHCQSNTFLLEIFELTKCHPCSSKHVSAISISPEQSPALSDLMARRLRIFNTDDEREPEGWTQFQPPPPVLGDPVSELTQQLDPVQACVPLFYYGWTLRIQGQLDEAVRCLKAAVSVATETSQRLVASTAYHQLAVAAHMRGDAAQSRDLNERSRTLNHLTQDIISELSSTWPRIDSAFGSLREEKLDEAERRFKRVVDFLENREMFRSHYYGATIGLGLVALERGELMSAQHLLQKALSDRTNLYPYIYVRTLLGLARIAHLQRDPSRAKMLLKKALDFAGQRSLVDEYAESVLEIARINPSGAPVQQLLGHMVAHLESIGFQAMLPALKKPHKSALAMINYQ